MIKLGVNIDHIASLRESRHTPYPDLVKAAAICEQAGAAGITVHLREDRRHIQDHDVYTLRRTIKTLMNLEMANNAEIVAIALKVRPDEVCMVPERRLELTTEGGLDVAGQRATLAPTVKALAANGTRVSMFIAPDIPQVEASAEIGAPCIELHTGAYANLAGDAQKRELDRLVAAAERARMLGLQVNAGHGISRENLAPILTIPGLDTLNIGHSIICDAVFLGLEAAVQAMLSRLN